MSIPTILFSTTQNFNPGDEVILMGIERLLNASGIRYHKRVYDRNPSNQQQRAEALADHNTPPPDYVIFAGTPEWCSEYPNLDDLIKGPYSARFFARILRLRQTDRSNDPLLRYIIKHGISCAMLGVGSSKPPVPTHKIDYILRELSDLFIVRDPQTYRCFSSYQPQLAPCPALFCAEVAEPRQSLKKIGITLQAPHSNLIRMNKQGFDYAISSYRAITQHYNNVEIICHTRQDSHYFQHQFPDAVINTLTDGPSLINTYSRFDAILSTRLHGCVAACSLGIPTFQLWHGLRMSTLEQIPVVNNKGRESALTWLQGLDINKQSTKIVQSNREAMEAYLEALTPLKQRLMGT